MQKNNAKNLLYIALLTSAVVLTWIGTSIYYSLSTSTTPVDTSKYSTPIAPAFDMTLLDSLSTRTTIPVDFSQKGIYTSSPDASESAAVTPIQESPQVPSTPLISPTNTPVIIEQTGSQSGVIEDTQPIDQESSQ
jgi:hypothetical protein